MFNSHLFGLACLGIQGLQRFEISIKEYLWKTSVNPGNQGSSESWFTKVLLTHSAVRFLSQRFKRQTGMWEAPHITGIVVWRNKNNVAN